MDDRQENLATANKPKDYAGLLWIFLAGALGLSLFCATSAIALSDPSMPTPIVIEPANIANLAFSNLNTAAALTANAFQQLAVPPSATPTFTATATETATPTFTPTKTKTRTPFVPSITPTKAREQQKPPIILPTATRTAIVISTITGTATVPDPPTDTPVPEPSNTPPPPTSTP